MPSPPNIDQLSKSCDQMICVFFLLCSSILQGNIPTYPDVVSQFNAPALVFIAHNTEDGQYFDDIQVGNVIHYNDGNEWMGYAMQATEPDSPRTRLIWNGDALTPEQIHQQIFNVPDTLILFTCIYKDGNFRWGRLFVIADRIEKSPAIGDFSWLSSYIAVTLRD
jgi:hypothetical protein